MFRRIEQALHVFDDEDRTPRLFDQIHVGLRFWNHRGVIFIRDQVAAS